MSGTTSQTDDHLIVRAQHGDRDAFALIVRRYLERVYRAAYAILRDHEDASDVAQDTFVRAYRSVRRFEVGRPIFPWLYRIARNLALNRIERVRGREQRLPDFDALVATGPGPEEALLADDEAARVRAAVALLPHQHRQIIELNHFQECSYKEIAAILEIPIGTVMSRLYHARRRLREILDEEMSHAGT